MRTRSSYTQQVGNYYQSTVYAGSVNYKDSNGNWQPINNNLETNGSSGWKNTGNNYSLLLPNSLTAPVQITSGSSWVKFQPNSASSAGTLVSGASITYSGVYSGVAITLTAQNDSVKESISLASASAQSSFIYSLQTSSDLTAKSSASGGVDFVNSAGTPVLQFAPPTMSDASGASSSAVTMTLGSQGASVSVSADPTWLDASGRSWPVVIDPTTYTADQNCYIANGGYANTHMCGGSSYSLYAGYDGTDVFRSVLLFNIQGVVRFGSQIMSGYLDLYSNYASTSSYQYVDIYPLSHSWTQAGVTWNKYDGTNSWTTAGGDYASTPTYGVQVTSTGAHYDWNNIANMLQPWVDSPQQDNFGIMLKSRSETTTETYGFNSTTSASNVPSIVFTWYEQTGDQGYYDFDTHKISDRTTVKVNLGTSELVVENRDLDIKGVGLDFNLDRTYNSRDVSGVGSAGSKWTLGDLDIGLYSVDGSDIALFGPTGYRVRFSYNGSTYTAPAYLDADLAWNSGSSTYTVTFHGSQEVWTFNSSGQIQSRKDRNGDTISYTWTSGKITSATDTEGRSITFTYGDATCPSLVTKAQDSTSRNVQYAYNSSCQLTTYTDANSKQYSYGYDSNGYLNSITDPLSNVTTITYTSYQVTGLQLGSTSGPTTSYAYYTTASAASTQCGTAPTGMTFDGYTKVTDPLNNPYESCLDARGQLVQWMGPLNTGVSSNTSTYNSDSHTTAKTDFATTPNTTTLTYDSNNNNTQVTAPKTGTLQTAASQSVAFNVSSSVTGYKYLPSSMTDAQGNCTSYYYDSAGNLTDVYSGQSSGCDGHTSGNHVQNKYQGDPGVTSCGGKTGELCSTTDAKSNTTTNGYDTNGNLTSITPPSPLGSTSITVDSLSRKSSVTDGKSQKTSYTYDPLDRVTQILYNGTSTCSSYTTCTTASYDADGNLTSTTDATGTTTYVYDSMNRMTKEELPSSSTACSGSSPAGITFGYDGNSNLTSYCDSGGTVNYGWCAANTLCAVAEPGGTLSSGVCSTNPCIQYYYDSDWRLNEIAFQSSANLKYTYDDASHIASVIGRDSSNNVLTSFSYSYASGTTDRALEQSMTEDDAGSGGTSLTTSYTYDASDRLTQATNSNNTWKYTYDANGNLCRTDGNACGTGGSDPYTYNSDNELTASPGVTSWSYDADGNVTGNSNSASITLNSQNQSTAMTYGGQTISSLAYTGQGQAGRTTLGSTSLVNTPLGVTVSTTSSSSTYYTRDPRGDVLGERTPDGKSWYYLKDMLNSIVAVIDKTGATVANRYGYGPYGTSITKSETVTNPWQYAGGYTDSTGLIKFGARYYDPNLVRWTQPDPIAAAGSPGTYAYAGDNPVNRVDPTGLAYWSFQWWGLEVDLNEDETQQLVWAYDAGVDTAGVCLSFYWNKLPSIAWVCGLVGAAAEIEGWLIGWQDNGNGVTLGWTWTYLDQPWNWGFPVISPR